MERKNNKKAGLMREAIYFVSAVCFISLTVLLPVAVRAEEHCVATDTLDPEVLLVCLNDAEEALIAGENASEEQFRNLISMIVSFLVRLEKRVEDLEE